MLTEALKKSELGYAYVHAVAARAGFAVERTSIDMDSIDLTIKAKGKLATDSILTSPSLAVQLKSTINCIVNNGSITYPLTIKNYQDLIQPDRAVPAILVLFCLPEEEVHWLTHSPDQLISKRCAFWLNLKGLPESSNETSQTIQLPVTNIFSPDHLKDLMIRISKQEL